MTSGSSFEYWGSVSGLCVEVKFYPAAKPMDSSHSVLFRSLHFARTETDIRGFCYHEEMFQMHHQKKVCSYLQSSHLTP